MVASSCFITDLACWPSIMSNSVSSTSFPDKCKYRLITNKKYIKGWWAAAHNQGGSDADEATFDCNNDNN